MVTLAYSTADTVITPFDFLNSCRSQSVNRTQISEIQLTEGNSKSFWFTWCRTYSIRHWFAGQANWHGGVSVVMADTIVSIASLMLFLISWIFCFFSSALKPLTCSIRICLTIVLFPDSPAPNSSSRWVARYICLSFWSCFSIFLLASLCCFSSFRWSSVLLLPRQPIFPKTQRQVQGGGRVVDWLVGWL